MKKINNMFAESQKEQERGLDFAAMIIIVAIVWILVFFIFVKGANDKKMEEIMCKQPKPNIAMVTK